MKRLRSFRFLSIIDSSITLIDIFFTLPIMKDGVHYFLRGMNSFSTPIRSGTWEMRFNNFPFFIRLIARIRNSFVLF
jgi:hypothetical protein